MRLLIFAIVLSLNIDSSFASEKLRYGKAEGWVDVSPISKIRSRFDGVVPFQGVAHHYRDVQVNVLDTTQVKTHVARQYKITSQPGLAGASNLKVYFSPAVESLILHSVELIHKGQILPVEIENKFDVIDDEEKIHDLIQTGEKFAYLPLKNVKVGDTVRYSYTIVRERTYDGQFTRFFRLAYNRQFGLLNYRILWPKDKPFSQKFFGAGGKESLFSKKPGEKFNQYTYTAENTPVVKFERFSPSWYLQFPTVQVSNSLSWKTYGASQLPYYRASEGEAVKDLAEQLKGDTPAESIINALRYSQREIRYLGIEIGHSGLIPFSPEKTLSLGYGDCKGKSVLLISILQAMGYQAHVALVDTRFQRALDEFLPGQVFNHAIVYVSLNGQSYWMDPTRYEQFGTLERFKALPFERALILADETTGLYKQETIPTVIDYELKEEFFLSDEDYENGKVLLTSTYRGDLADRNYQSVMSNIGGLSRLNSSLAFYDNIFKSAEMVDEIRYDFDRKKNELKIYETYKLSGLWEELRDDDHYSLRFGSHLMVGNFEDSKVFKRQSPFQVPGREAFKHQVIFTFPFEFEAGVKEKKQENDFFDFSYRRSIEKVGEKSHKLTFSYVYKSKAEVIFPDQREDFNKELETLRETNGIVVSVPKEKIDDCEGCTKNEDSEGRRAEKTVYPGKATVGLSVNSVQKDRRSFGVVATKEVNPTLTLGVEYARQEYIDRDGTDYREVALESNIFLTRLALKVTDNLSIGSRFGFAFHQSETTDLRLEQKFARIGGQSLIVDALLSWQKFMAANTWISLDTGLRSTGPSSEVVERSIGSIVELKFGRSL